MKERVSRFSALQRVPGSCKGDRPAAGEDGSGAARPSGFARARRDCPLQQRALPGARNEAPDSGANGSGTTGVTLVFYL